VIALVVLVPVGGDLVERWMVPADTVVGKALGGMTRVGTFALFVYPAPPEGRPALVVVGGVLIVVTYSCEATVTWHELRSGERPVS
jgi:hypothetical protein